MSIFYDCHLHSSFSADSETPAEAMIQRAISIGLSGMCFTEHLDTDCPPKAPTFASIFRPILKSSLHYGSASGM